jgi:putative ABC transport system substrate-binding protein
MGCSAVGFIVTLILSLLAAPLAATAQQAAKVPQIGWLSGASAEALAPLVEAFRQGLRELGYLEGQNLTIVYRFWEGRDERLRDFAAELVRLNSDIFITSGTLAALAAKHATETIPVVSVSGDPVGIGLVASLAHPGGNVTGLTVFTTGLEGKRLELLKTAVPEVCCVAVLANGASTYAVLYWAEVQAAAQELGVQVHPLDVRGPDDFKRVFEAVTPGRMEGLTVFDNPLVFNHRTQIMEFAAQRRLPAVYARREWVESGGLMAYGPSFVAIFRRAAAYVDKILKGTKPADLPIERPAKFELVINLKTTKALGLTIPPLLLFQADEVIK